MLFACSRIVKEGRNMAVPDGLIALAFRGYFLDRHGNFYEFFGCVMGSYPTVTQRNVKSQVRSN